MTKTKSFITLAQVLEGPERLEQPVPLGAEGEHVRTQHGRGAGHHAALRLAVQRELHPHCSLGEEPKRRNFPDWFRSAFILSPFCNVEKNVKQEYTRLGYSWLGLSIIN